MDREMKFPGLDIYIKDTQKIQLEILLEFDRVCKKNDIKYQLFAGTLIGAIRYKGFIPWDDDIDVCMLREEYDKFLEVASKDLDGKFFLQNYLTDKNFIHQFTRITKNGTLYVQDRVSEIEMHKGIFIDIFPYDNIKPGTFSGEVQRITLDKLNIISNCRIKKRNKQARNKLVKNIRMAIYYILKLVPKEHMDKFITKIACRYNKESTMYVGDLSLSTDKTSYKKFTVEKSDFYDSIDWEFEDYKFPVPRNYDNILRRGYGDYMTPPPLEEQVPHHNIIEIDLGINEKPTNS